MYNAYNVRWGHDGLLSPEIIQRLDSGDEHFFVFLGQKVDQEI